MLVLAFSGWFQCRLPTDPDPTDEPRGVSGFTFALPGEPDFDRVIRFHEPVAPRSHGPEVGVFVTSASVGGERISHHPLAGARLDLRGQPRFEARNYVLGNSSQGSIVPFILELSAGELVVEREDILYPADPERPLHRIPAPHVGRRGSIIPLTIDALRIADATGITDPLAYRRHRRSLLLEELEGTADPVARAALGKRISELEITSPESLQVATLTLYNDYRFAINGPARIDDPRGELPEALDVGSDWPIQFWMGGWDSDALCGHVRGILSIPLRERAG